MVISIPVSRIMDDIRKRKIIRSITQFIKAEIRTRKSNGLIIGMSGGIDSSVAAWLAVKALGTEKVFGLILPDSSVTPRKDTKDAEELAQKLKINYKVIEVGKSKNQLLRHLPKNKLARANFLVRLRMSILYYYAALLDRLVIGTGDKSELRLGYFTKYGDAAVDLMPLGDLYKTEVRELAEFMQIPSKICRKKSSARLWKGQTTEGEIGLAYEKIDSILMQFENLQEGKRKVPNIRPQSFDNVYTGTNGRRIRECSAADVKRVLAIIERNGHKLTPAPICRIR
ncbi:MAG: NAD+ synthase [Nitrososphaeraceae archaeon]